MTGLAFRERERCAEPAELLNRENLQGEGKSIGKRGYQRRDITGRHAG